jgi:hypothetical protein
MEHSVICEVCGKQNAVKRCWYCGKNMCLDCLSNPVVPDQECGHAKCVLCNKSNETKGFDEKYLALLEDLKDKAVKKHEKILAELNDNGSYILMLKKDIERLRNPK